MIPIKGSLDFVVHHDQRIILMGWLETGDKCNQRIFLHGAQDIEIMPEDSAWYFRRDVNTSLNAEDEIKRGFVFAFPDNVLKNEALDFVVGDDDDDEKQWFKKNIDPHQIRKLEALSDTEADFIGNIFQDKSAKRHQFRNRIEMSIDHFFWLSDHCFVVSGGIDTEGHFGKNTTFSVIAGNEKISPSSIIYGERENLKDDSTIMTDTDFILIVEVGPERGRKDLDRLQLQVRDKNRVGYAQLTLKEKLTLEEKSKILLSHIDLDSGKLFSVFDGGIGLALSALWDQIYASDDLKIDIKEYGNPPADPKVSLIVPLYGRIDLIMYQMSIFANDPDFLKHAQLIYVLDDPRQYKSVWEYVEALYPVYRVPLKLIRYDKNLGYAKANNIGARHATANVLILMNSDVMPKTVNWVSQSLKIFEVLENVGAAGIKLLYEDQTVQHQGMVFERLPALDNAWVNIHPGKNMSDTGHNKQTVAVPAVTGAFLMTPKALYDAVGGLDEGYILGDFEDSDYCLKLYEKGYFTYYIPHIEMYHLERQSQSMVDTLKNKKKITLFNCWKHSFRWNDTIEKLTKEYNNEQ